MENMIGKAHFFLFLQERLHPLVLLVDQLPNFVIHKLYIHHSKSGSRSSLNPRVYTSVTHMHLELETDSCASTYMCIHPCVAALTLAVASENGG